MKHNWEYKRLGDVCTFERGITYSKEDESEQVSDIIVLRSNNIDLETHSLNFSDLKYLNKSFRTNNDKKLRANSILICLSNGSLTHLGKTAYVERDYDMMFGGFMGLIVPKQQNPKYISYIFRSSLYFKFIDSLNRGANIRNLQVSKLSNLSIPVPPMEVQEQIVAELDKINEVIDDCRELLRNLDVLAQSLFYDTFGDPIANPKGFQQQTVKEVSTVKIGPFGSLLHKEDYISGGTPLINPIHMQGGYVQIDNNFTINDTKKQALLSYLLKSDDIVFGRRGDIGRCALITSKENGFLCGTGSLFVRFKITINPIFALWCFKQQGVIKFLTDKAKGATMLNINCGIVESIPLIMPPIALQEQFATQVERIEEQKKALEATIAELQTLLDSRMDYWFN